MTTKMCQRSSTDWQSWLNDYLNNYINTSSGLMDELLDLHYMKIPPEVFENDQLREKVCGILNFLQLQNTKNCQYKNLKEILLLIGIFKIRGRQINELHDQLVNQISEIKVENLIELKKYQRFFTCTSAVHEMIIMAMCIHIPKKKCDFEKKDREHIRYYREIVEMPVETIWKTYYPSG